MLHAHHPLVVDSDAVPAVVATTGPNERRRAGYDDGRVVALSPRVDRVSERPGPRPEGVYRGVGEAAWGWVLAQVRDDDGPWIPESVVPGKVAHVPDYRDGLHSGIGGLAYVLAEIRMVRGWTAQEQDLAEAMADRLRREIDRTEDCTFFDGLSSTVGALIALN